MLIIIITIIVSIVFISICKVVVDDDYYDGVGDGDGDGIGESENHDCWSEG
jgi:hypothetical protein